MENEYRQSMSWKRQLFTWFLHILEMIVKSVLENSTFETDGKHTYYAYNAMACR